MMIAGVNLICDICGASVFVHDIEDLSITDGWISRDGGKQHICPDCVGKAPKILTKEEDDDDKTR